MKICQKCGHENNDTGKFCEECGEKLLSIPKFCPNCGSELGGTPKFCPECGCNLTTEEMSSSQNDEASDEETHKSESVFSLPHRYVLSAAKKFFDLENTSYSEFTSDFCRIKRSMLDYFGNIDGSIKNDYRNCLFFNNYINAKNFVCLISEKNNYCLGLSEIKDSGVIVFTTNGFLYQKNMQSPQTYIKFEDIIDCKIMNFKNQINSVIHYLSNNEKKSLMISEEIYNPKFLIELIEELSSDNKSDMNVNEDEIPLEMIKIPGSKTSVLAVPVIQRLYEIVMKSNPSRFKNATDSFLRPVENVTQIDAFVFCNRLSVLNKRTPCYSYKNDKNPDHWPDYILRDDDSFKCDFKASGYRLLTDYEWEIAAKGNQQYQHAGGNKIKGVGWCQSNSKGETHSVKQKWPNGYRLYDMNGNVWEWVDSGGVYGGSWKDGNGSYKFNVYKYISPNEKYDDVGFRIASGPELIYERYGYEIHPDGSVVIHTDWKVNLEEE